MRPTTYPQGQVGPPEPILAPNLTSPTNGQKDPRTQTGHFQPLNFGNHQRPPAQAQQVFPFINVLCTIDSGVVHIWYNIPLCTNFAQQSNGDGFRTKFGHFKSSPQFHHPFLKEVFSVIQSCNSWRLPEYHLRTPSTWPCRSWVVIYFRIPPRAILRGYQASNKLSRHEVLQYSLDNSIGPYRL
ncbi:hypothetical protein O181_080502 [Austropuccinia psidii MF-1]|uniref:Uncharacterized protein n=1 Tax=Austropuccinia psidii MF-1 TaxID=1389203 RepID=A0A9Q3FLR1_9BASI|nr:hypothetical protein [Austropuccinia psidii MF-1]